MELKTFSVDVSMKGKGSPSHTEKYTVQIPVAVNTTALDACAEIVVFDDHQKDAKQKRQVPLQLSDPMKKR